VINLSLGRPVFSSYCIDPLCQAVQAAWNAGIVVVIAAGNDGRDNSFGNQGYATIFAPGNSPVRRGSPVYSRNYQLVARLERFSSNERVEPDFRPALRASPAAPGARIFTIVASLVPPVTNEPAQMTRKNNTRHQRQQQRYQDVGRHSRFPGALWSRSC